MNDITLIPLPNELLASLCKMHVSFFHCNKTGRSFISRGYWEKIDDNRRRVLTAIVMEAVGHE